MYTCVCQNKCNFKEKLKQCHEQIFTKENIKQILLLKEIISGAKSANLYVLISSGCVLTQQLR